MIFNYSNIHLIIHKMDIWNGLDTCPVPPPPPETQEANVKLYQSDFSKAVLLTVE